MPSVYEEDTDRLRAQLAEPPATPEQIGLLVRAQEALSQFVPKLDRDTRNVVILRWVQKLDGIPKPMLVRAFEQWDDPRMPTPTQIRDSAREMMRHADRRVNPPQTPVWPLKEPERPPRTEPLTSEQLAELDRRRAGLEAAVRRANPARAST